MIIFVGNLHEQVTEYQLRAIFSEFGEVKSVKIILNNYTKHTKGYGFIEMWKRVPGEEAIKNLDNTIVCMQAIKVREAFLRADKPTN